MSKFAVNDRFRVPYNAELEELQGEEGVVMELPQGNILPQVGHTIPMPPISEFTPIYKVAIDGEVGPRYLEETQMEAV